MEAARERLPNRRAHEIVEFNHRGFRYTAGFGRFADGRLAEIFLSANKTGAELDVAARDSAIVASIALQYGTPVEMVRHALTRNVDGSASGPLGGMLDLLAAGARP
jgi:ribonucleoside-diphosphate reductase alpha chain